MSSFTEHRSVSIVWHPLRCLGLLLVLVTSWPAFAALSRLNLDSAQAQSNGWSEGISISADGRYVAFASRATNLVANDTNGAQDIFVRDTQTNTTSRVSVASDGTQADGMSCDPAISGNGRYVAFASAATNLVANDTNNALDIFVRDLQTDTTSRVSVDSSETAGNGDSMQPALNTTGTLLVFASQASNLVTSDSNGVSDIFLRDLAGGTTVCVSAVNSGTEANNASFTPAISGDGLRVVFASLATNLIETDTNGIADIFLRNYTAGTLTRVSISTSGVQADGASATPAISANGRYIAYASTATNLVTGDTNAAADIFRYDLDTLTAARVSLTTAGVEAAQCSATPRLDSTGDRIIFASRAHNLAGDETGNDYWDVYMRTVSLNKTARMSGGDGAAGNSDSGCYGLALNSSGSFCGLWSAASNLVASDTNSTGDLFASTLTPSTYVSTTNLTSSTTFTAPADALFGTGWFSVGGVTTLLKTPTPPAGFDVVWPAAGGHSVNRTNPVNLTAAGISNTTRRCQVPTSYGALVTATLALNFAPGQRGRVHINWGSWTDNSKGGAKLTITDNTTGTVINSTTNPELAYELAYNAPWTYRETIIEVGDCQSLTISVQDNNSWSNYGRAWMSAIYVEPLP